MVTFWSDIESIYAELKSYNYIFACESAAIDLVRKGIVLEAVVSDFDSVDEEQLAIEELEAITKVIVLDKIKDETDTRALLMYIVEKYVFSELVLYNSFDNRIDHALCLFSLFEKVGLLKIRTTETLITMLKPGQHEIKATDQNFTYISFIALETVNHLKIRNLKYETDKELVNAFSDLLVSNEFLPDNITGEITFNSGKILVIQSKDKKRCEQ
jgi:thiamine pyrophosphokinase